MTEDTRERCWRCGEPILPTYKSLRYCSPRCQNAHHLLRCYWRRQWERYLLERAA